jgi:4-aminobutyrate aminotransferase/(S)-3-amino-2-methylpropionate transaminase
MTGTELPQLKTEIPGPRSRARVDVLAKHECPAITARRARRAAALGKADDDPIVWDSAVGGNIRDVDGNVYVDVASGFGVALMGHRHPRVVAATEAQERRLLHAMGDTWPDDTRIALLEALARVTPGDLSVSILGLSGSDAVDAAVKTAVLATGRTGVLCFEGGYHGLALGALGLQGYNPKFTAPFRDIVHPSVAHLPWCCDPTLVDDRLSKGDIGLLLVEPVQGRGGMREPTPGWIAELRAIARRHGVLVAFDEIFCGFGRTGDRFACEAEGVVPDLLCVGKALGGGFPLSACVGSPQVMAAWGASTGEALHTQTFLGHPVGCAAALAVIAELEGPLLGQVRALSASLQAKLTEAGFQVRGRGLMLGVPLPDPLRTCRDLLARGFITLPAGARPDVLGVTPPACLTEAQADAFVAALTAVG